MIKEFKGWLVLNYRTGEMKVGKRKPIKPSASEIPIELKLNVNVPEIPQITATGSITLSEAKVNEMVIEQL